MISEVFEVNDVCRTLNASETIARGCSLMSAMMSPLFKVAQYGVEEYNNYPIRASWNFAQQMEIENDTEKNNGLLFPKGCNFGSIKSISFTKPGPFELKFAYD